MKRALKMVPVLAVVAAVSLPTQSFAANTNVKAGYLVDADVNVSGTTIELNAGLNGGALVKSNLLKGITYEIVDANSGKTLYTKNTTEAKINAKIENLKPSVEYCLDVRVKGKVLKDLVKADLKLNADQKLKLTKKGLKIKDSLLCVTTGDEPSPKDPKNPDKPKDPKVPNDPKTPENPKDPKTPENPKDPKQPDPKKPDNPKQPPAVDPKTEPMKPVKENPEPTLWERFVSLFS